MMTAVTFLAVIWSYDLTPHQWVATNVGAFETREQCEHRLRANFHYGSSQWKYWSKDKLKFVEHSVCRQSISDLGLAI